MEITQQQAFTKESFNAALNAAKVEIKPGHGVCVREVTAKFKVGEMDLEVSVEMTPKVFSPYYGRTGVDFRVLHRKSESGGTYIHWDDRGEKQVDIGFEIERLDELVKLATPTSEELAQTLKEVQAAVHDYNHEMGIHQESQARSLISNSGTNNLEAESTDSPHP